MPQVRGEPGRRSRERFVRHVDRRPSRPGPAAHAGPDQRPALAARANIAAPTADLNTIPIAMIDARRSADGRRLGRVRRRRRRRRRQLHLPQELRRPRARRSSTASTITTTTTRICGQINLDANFTRADKHVNDGRVVTLWGVMGANIGRRQRQRHRLHPVPQRASAAAVRTRLLDLRDRHRPRLGSRISVWVRRTARPAASSR